MTWIDTVKGFFRRAASPEDAGTGIRLVAAAENPYGVDIWNCAAFTQSMLAMSSDPAVAARFTRLRGSTGAEHRDQMPANASTTECALLYGITSEFRDGPLFTATEMEDKWDLFFFSPHIYFVRSWNGQLIYRAAVSFEQGRMKITRIESAQGHEPEYGRRAVDYLVKSHLLGAVVPHPLPPDLPADPMQIAGFSFANFGRRCLYGTYADTTVLPGTAGAAHGTPRPSVRQPANEGVIRYLDTLKGNAAEDDRPPRPGGHDYTEAGAHPDAAERIWDQLGKTLPAESRRVVCGRPALVHPASKVLIAVAFGTQYAIRLPSHVLRSGVPSTVRTETVWSTGGRMNVQAAFGSDWAFGSYASEEETWCRQSFEEHA